MKNIFLIGYYGYQNIGDEALLEAIAKHLMREGEVSVSALTYHAQATEEQYKIQAVSRSNYKQILKAIKQADVVISGGGSILQDTTSSKSLYYYLGILLISHWMKKPIYLLGNGYGPIKRPFNLALLKVLVPKFKGVITRDQEAFEAFSTLNPQRIYPGVDCVWLRQALKPEEVQRPRPYVALSLRPWHHKDTWLPLMGQVIDKLNSLGYDTVLVPMKAPDDLLISQGLTVNRPYCTLVDHQIKAVEEALAQATFVMGMRLHALILAGINQTPFIAISYDPKVTSFTQQVSQVMGGHVNQLDMDHLLGCIDHMHAHLEDYRESLNQSIPDMTQRAKDQMLTLSTWLSD